MCLVSVIVPNYANNIKQCLESVLNQSLEEIEIICLFDDSNYSIFDDFSKIDNRIRLISCNQQLNEVLGEYVISVRDVISNGVCEFLYNFSKSQDLDSLYVPNYDFFIEECVDINGLQITPINFTSFYKNKFFNGNLEQINLDCDNSGVYNKCLYLSHNLNLKFIEKTLKYCNNNLFLILIKYLFNLELNERQLLYDLIKDNFKIIDLTNENKIIYNLILKNKNYIDFCSEFYLGTVNYDIYENPEEIPDYKISLVIPIYNNETLIHRTLMSIENQKFDFKEIEVLMVNDASTDNTLHVINAYVNKYPNFKAIHIKNGTGSAGTPRNLGLNLASADYVMFIDHDDFLEIDALEKLYKTITNYDCDFVYGTYALIDSDKPIKFTYPNEKHGFFKNLEDNEGSITTPPSIWTKLFKKEFLLKNKILFPTILGEDVIFISKALMSANGVYYLWDDVIYYYNLNENSFTMNLSYDYFVEGFTSERYLFDLYSGWNHKNYYALRGQGILDYYINRFLDSTLDENEIKKIFSLFYEFCNRLHILNISPKHEKNQIVFDFVIRKDVESLIKFKNYKPSKFKRISNKILNKINKHGFW